MKKVFLLLTMIVLTASAYAQNSTIDVLKLKNGNTMRGMITKETYGENAAVTIDLGMGNLLTFKTSEIEERSREVVKAAVVAAPPVAPAPPVTPAPAPVAAPAAPVAPAPAAVVAAPPVAPTAPVVPIERPQNTGSRGFFTAGFMAGGGTGDIGGTDINKMFSSKSNAAPYEYEAAQFGTANIALSLDGLFIFRNSIVGIATTAQYSVLGMDNTALATSLRSESVKANSANAAFTYTAMGQSYQSINTMIGIGVSPALNTSKTLYIDVRAMGGLGLLLPQTVTLQATNGSAYARINYNYSSTVGAALQGDLGLRLNLQRLSLRFALNYSEVYAADRAGDYFTTSFNGSQQTSSSTQTIKLKSTAISCLGVGLHIGFTL